MPQEPFEALCLYIHLNDSTRMPGRDDANYDPLYKLRLLIDMCQQNFRELH